MCSVRHALPPHAELAEKSNMQRVEDQSNAVKPMEIDDSLYRYVCAYFEALIVRSVEMVIKYSGAD